MKKKILVLCMVVITGCAVLGGCMAPSTEKARFIGSWSGTYSWAGNLSRKVPATITFFSNGTYTATLPLIQDTGTWDIQNGKLLKTPGNNPAVMYTFSFSNHNTSLVLASEPINEQWNLTKH